MAHYDLQRTVNEYEITKTISSKTPDRVVPPLALLDLKQNHQNMKLLVTEWSKADEQFCNQFIDGSVDCRSKDCTKTCRYIGRVAHYHRL